MAKVGLIGIGLIGKALAERMLKAGYSVTGFDVDVRCMDELARLGGQPATTSAAVVLAADVCVLSLPDSSIVATVLDEIAPHLRGKQLIDTTTGDPADSTALGERLKQLEVPFLDATIVGSSKQVRQGEVILLVGGDEATFGRWKPLFASFAKDSFYLGAAGSGAKMKLVVNLVLGLNRAVLAEGLAFAAACGVEQERALEVLRSGMAYSRIMDTKGEKMLKRDFSVEAKLAQHHKDVRLILALAAQLGARVPLSIAHDRILAEAESLGLGAMDNSAIIEAFGKKLPT